MTGSPRNVVRMQDYLPPLNDWFVLALMRESSRKWDWVALMIDVHPDDYCRGDRTARQCWFCVPGKHRNKDAAWDALEGLMATRRCGTAVLAHVTPTTIVDENGEPATLN